MYEPAIYSEIPTKKNQKKIKIKKLCITVTPKLKYSSQIRKFSIQELDFKRSVFMAAICYSNPFWNFFSTIEALPCKISHAKSREDIFLNK